MDRNPYKTPLVRMVNYTDPIEVDFEGRKFFAARDYEKVLDYCFGHDWKMYPTTRGRHPAHNAMMEIIPVPRYDFANYDGEECVCVVNSGVS